MKLLPAIARSSRSPCAFAPSRTRPRRWSTTIYRSTSATSGSCLPTASSTTSARMGRGSGARPDDRRRYGRRTSCHRPASCTRRRRPRGGSSWNGPISRTRPRRRRLPRRRPRSASVVPTISPRPSRTHPVAPTTMLSPSSRARTSIRCRPPRPNDARRIWTTRACPALRPCCSLIPSWCESSWTGSSGHSEPTYWVASPSPPPTPSSRRFCNCCA
mmetsp:Transcript_27894/g.65482  ORF Transcript_27894/g.65482 Transcript_27894/m.65482 type:complete len:216 (-) Transcript_27894:592-1239(-)